MHKVIDPMVCWRDAPVSYLWREGRMQRPDSAIWLRSTLGQMEHLGRQGAATRSMLPDRVHLPPLPSMEVRLTDAIVSPCDSWRKCEMCEQWRLWFTTCYTCDRDFCAGCVVWMDELDSGWGAYVCVSCENQRPPHCYNGVHSHRDGTRDETGKAYKDGLRTPPSKEEIAEMRRKRDQLIAKTGDEAANKDEQQVMN